MTEFRRPPSIGFDAAPDDFEHPKYEQLEALVDDRLDAIDREWVVSHVEACEICREDVGDLAQVRLSLDARATTGTAAATRMPRAGRLGKQAIQVGAVAAGVVLAIWVIGRLSSPEFNTPMVSPTPAPGAVPTLAPISILTDDERRGVEGALESGRVEWPPNVDLLLGHTGILLGPEESPPAFRPIAPAGTAVVTPRPEFSWTPSAGATTYSVAVFDERFNEVAASGPISRASWTPERDLPRGGILAWQVSATSPQGTLTSPAPPQPEARFLVLTPAAAADVAGQRTRLSGEPVALGLALARVGLFAEAEYAFSAALADPRYDPARVRTLLARLRAR